MPRLRARLNARIAVISGFILLLSVISCTLTFLVRNAAAQQNRMVDRYLKRYRRIQMDPIAVARRVRTTGEFSLPTDDGEFQLALVPNDVRAPRYRAEAVGTDGVTRPVIPEQLHTFRGTAPGIPGTEARFSIRDDSVEGILLTANAWYLIEPMRHYDPASPADEMVVYRASDIEPLAFGTCGTALAEQIGSQIFNIQETLVPQILAASGLVAVADVATEADYEYVSVLGNSASANNSILDIMNQVDGIYQMQLSLSLRVVYQHTWESSADPYSSTAPATMLNEFRSYWTTNFNSVPFDLAHMWTGKDMDGSTVGIAYLGVACNARSYSYGVSQRFNASPGKYILTAHEIGHNFGAIHTEDANPPQTDCGNTIMNASIGTGTGFCPYSRNEISTHVTQNSSCLATVSNTCDINSDGQINVLDIQSLANTILGLAACPGNCDSNKDGSVNVLDVQLQANIVLGVATCP
jgi:hypothetical protein